MSENEIILDNILSEVMDYIRQLKTKRSAFGGYDKEYVLYTIQEICNLYEKQISKICSDNKTHFDMLNKEISELRQRNEVLSRRTTADPSIIDKANQSIAEANSRIEAANNHIAKLQALYEEAEAKLREKEAYIGSLLAGSQAPLSGARDSGREVLRNDRVVQNADTSAEVKASAEEIIRRARDEAEKLRNFARCEAESIIRERRAEMRAEERLHEELLSELKNKYVKYREFFSKMQEGIKEIESEIDPMILRHDEFKAENYDSYDRISHLPWNDDFPNNFRKGN